MKNKTLEIIKREYITRVRKKSFIIMTILMPIFLILLIIAPTVITNLKTGIHKIGVLDESGYFLGKLKNSKNIYYTTVNSDLKSMKKNYKLSFDGFLYIPKIDVNRPSGIRYYSDKQPGLMLLNDMKNQISSIIKDLRLQNYGLDKQFLKKLEVNVNIDTIDLSSGKEKNKNSKIAAGVSYFIGLILYLLLLTYGTMIMKGVQEEKYNKIIEIIISSVKPTQLMLGKIIGLALVALTQILIWIIILSILLTFTFLWILPSSVNTTVTASNTPTYIQSSLNETIEGLKTLNYGYLFIMFIIFSIGGYLFYSSIFAAIGSLSDETTENQSITFPIILPIIVAFFISISVMEQPNGQFAFWSSLIPFFSPIVMMSRIPFGVPAWQIILSILLLIGGILLNVFLSAKIYRTAILMYGKKISFKEILRWILEK